MGGTAGSGEGGGVGNRRTVVSSRESRRSRRGDDGDSEAHEASEGIRRRGYHFVRVVGVGILDDFDSRLRPGVLSGHGTLAGSFQRRRSETDRCGGVRVCEFRQVRRPVAYRIGLEHDAVDRREHSSAFREKRQEGRRRREMRYLMPRWARLSRVGRTAIIKPATKFEGLIVIIPLKAIGTSRFFL